MLRHKSFFEEKILMSLKSLKENVETEFKGTALPNNNIMQIIGGCPQDPLE